MEGAASAGGPEGAEHRAEAGLHQEVVSGGEGGGQAQERQQWWQEAHRAAGRLLDYTTLHFKCR